MKKVLALFISGFTLLGMMAACGNNASSQSNANSGSATDGGTSSASDSAATGEKKLVYIFVKNRGDLSYWDSIAEGGDRAAIDFADRADIKVMETTADLQANLDAMYEAADAGADLIMTASDFKDNIVTIANEFPDIACVSLSEDNVDQAKNIYGIDFRSSESAFLGGIVAADIASSGIEGTSASKVIGFIGGMDETVVIQEFFLGYIQGAKYFDKDTKVEYNYVGGWGDPDTARTQALAQYNSSNAEVIFAAAGGSGNGVHTAASEAKKFVIGVDSDQSLQYQNDETISSRFATSVLKFVGNGVYDTIDMFLTEGTLPFGVFNILGIKNNAVGIVENDLFDAYVSDKGKEVLAQARKDISDGKVVIEGAIGKSQEEIKALITELING